MRHPIPLPCVHPGLCPITRKEINKPLREKVYRTPTPLHFYLNHHRAAQTTRTTATVHTNSQGTATISTGLIKEHTQHTFQLTHTYCHKYSLDNMHTCTIHSLLKTHMLTHTQDTHFTQPPLPPHKWHHSSNTSTKHQNTLTKRFTDTRDILHRLERISLDKRYTTTSTRTSHHSLAHYAPIHPMSKR